MKKLDLILLAAFFVTIPLIESCSTPASRTLPAAVPQLTMTTGGSQESKPAQGPIYTTPVIRTITPTLSSSTTQSTGTLEYQQLQKLHYFTHSTDYSNALIELSGIQTNSSQLVTFIEGLPQLPPLLQYVTIGDIQTAVQSAQQIRSQLLALPSLPGLLPGFPLPPAPPPIKDAVQKLENAREDILIVTEPIAQLPDLPTFVPNADSLQQARQRIHSHLVDSGSTISDIASNLQRLKALSEKPGVRLAEFQSSFSPSIYQTTTTKFNQVNTANSQLLTLVKSLPPLPSSIANVPVNKVEDAVNKTRTLNALLRALPPLPPLNSDLATLETLRLSTIKLTDIVTKLPSLPAFISGSRSLEDWRLRTQNYLTGFQNAYFHGSSIMQQINQILGSN